MLKFEKDKLDYFICGKLFLLDKMICGRKINNEPLSIKASHLRNHKYV